MATLTSTQNLISRQILSKNSPSKHFKNSLQQIGFSCLDGKTILEAEVSDHYPIISGGVLFWNIMKKCQFNEKFNYFNNGFEKVETNLNYLNRLEKIALVLDELVSQRDDVQFIAFCEGPIGKQSEIFYHLLTKQKSLKNFINSQGCFLSAFQDKSFCDWGLLLLSKYSQFGVYESLPEIEALGDTSIKNRIGLFRFQSTQGSLCLMLGHLPLSRDDGVTKEEELSPTTIKYIGVLNKILVKFEDQTFYMACDFNFNPNFIKGYKNSFGCYIPAHNNLKIHGENKEFMTVDGIVPSRRVVQQNYHADVPRLFLDEKTKKILEMIYEYFLLNI